MIITLNQRKLPFFRIGAKRADTKSLSHASIVITCLSVTLSHGIPVILGEFRKINPNATFSVKKLKSSIQNNYFDTGKCIV